MFLPQHRWDTSVITSIIRPFVDQLAVIPIAHHRIRITSALPRPILFEHPLRSRGVRTRIRGTSPLIRYTAWIERSRINRPRFTASKLPLASIPITASRTSRTQSVVTGQRSRMAIAKRGRHYRLVAPCVSHAVPELVAVRA
jgi:hypothetical protein